jgi:cytochrome c556
MSVIFVRTLIAVAGASLFVGVAIPQERSSEDVIKGRQSNLHDLGAAYKSLSDELRKSKPVPLLLQQYIGQIGELAKQREYWFPRGTGPEAGIDTKAKPSIWTSQEDFARRMQVFALEAEKLLALENSSDIASIFGQVRVLGESCKSCHDKYREPED